MQLVIRSYDRPDIIVKKTLQEIKKQQNFDIPVWLVLANEEEKEKYKEVISSYPFAGVLLSGIGGNVAINKAIDHFPTGEKLIFMDDDLSSFHRLERIDGKLQKFPLTNLQDYFRYIFNQLDKYNISAFTVDYTSNLLFKANSPFFAIRRRTIGGAMWGMVNDKNAKLDLAHNDDNLRATYFLEKDGRIGCLNHIICNTAYGKTKGGMQSSGDRGSGDRVEKTLELTNQAFSLPNVAKYYNIVFDENANCWNLKFKSKRELSHLPKVEDIVFTGNFQEYPDNHSNVSIDNFI